MKHTGFFKTFLEDVVNLNSVRLTLLDDSVEAIKSFIRASDWEPRVRGFLPQGSWAHKTIIRPLDGSAFDADILVRVDAVEGWEAKDYVNALRAEFRTSSIYKDKASSSSHCVTITYAGQRKIDIAPLVIDRQGYASQEVCNRNANAFQDSEPKAYTDWIQQRNGYSGGNTFRKVTRLLKYLRDTKRTFKCPSVLLTTLLGDRITYLDQGTENFDDTPTALQTVMGRLDDYLQRNPTRPLVGNPSMMSEDLGALLSQDEYSNFRNFVNKYRGWIDDAVGEDDTTASIEAWQKIFGDKFGTNTVAKAVAGISGGITDLTEATSIVTRLMSSVAEHPDSLVEYVRDFGVRVLPSFFSKPKHMQTPPWPQAVGTPEEVFVSAKRHSAKDVHDGRSIASGDALNARGGLWFEARLWAGAPIDTTTHRIQWRITNTGRVAMAIRAGRGDFYSSDNGTRRWESLKYRGVHLAEVFVLRRRDDAIVATSKPFYVVVE